MACTRSLSGVNHSNCNRTHEHGPLAQPLVRRTHLVQHVQAVGVRVALELVQNGFALSMASAMIHPPWQQRRRGGWGPPRPGLGYSNSRTAAMEAPMEQSALRLQITSMTCKRRRP